MYIIIIIREPGYNRAYLNFPGRVTDYCFMTVPLVRESAETDSSPQQSHNAIASYPTSETMMHWGSIFEGTVTQVSDNYLISVWWKIQGFILAYYSPPALSNV